MRLHEPDEGSRIARGVCRGLNQLRDSGVRFALLRGDGILGGKVCGDIDLVVHPRDANSAQQMLERVLESEGVRVYERHRAGHLRQIYLHSATSDGHEFFAVDIHTAECFFGVPFESARRLLDVARLDGGIERVPEPVVAVVQFLSAGLTRGGVPEKLAVALRQAFAEDRPTTRTWLERSVGTALAARVEDAVLDTAAEGAPRLARLARPLKRALLLRACTRRPLATITASIAFTFGARIRPLFRPRGVVLAFLGTDGSGKSTLLDAVVERLGGAYRGRRPEVHHMRPGLLPQINTLLHFGRTTYTLEDMSRPHRAKPSGPLGSALRGAYYWLDYLFGYFARVHWVRRHHALVAFDRYYYDYLVDPMRSRIRKDTGLVRALSRRVPKPDHVFVCLADPDVIWSRKQELARDEVERQVGAFEDLAEERGFHVVRTEQSLEECVDSVLDRIFEPAA